MSKLVCGMTIKALCELCKISRMTLNRYRKNPHWPGDDAPLDYIKAFIVSKRSSNRSGRKKKQPATPGPVNGKQAAAPTQSAQNKLVQSLDNNLDNEFNNIQYILNLDDELKRTVIEKNKAQVAKYQQSCLQEYRDGLQRKMSRGVSFLINELREMNLTRAQLLNLQKALLRMVAVMTDREDEFELGEQPMTEELKTTVPLD